MKPISTEMNSDRTTMSEYFFLCAFILLFDSSEDHTTLTHGQSSGKRPRARKERVVMNERRARTLR